MGDSRSSGAVLILALCFGLAATLDAQARLDLVRKRGTLVCGVTPGVHGFATVDKRGRYTGRNSYDDPVEGRILLLVGNFSEEFDENFNVVSPLAGKGQVVDLCAGLG